MTQATEKDIGKWCKFITHDRIDCIAKLWCVMKRNNCDYYLGEGVVNEYTICTPLTQEQIKCLGLEE